MATDDKIKGPWSEEEDAILRKLVEEKGAKNWSEICESIPGRSGKSCRLRWCNQLSPEVDRRPFSSEEDTLIIEAHKQIGNKWAAIARMLSGRTDNAVKNHWNSTLKKRLEREALGEERPLQVLRRSESGDVSTEMEKVELSPESEVSDDLDEAVKVSEYFPVAPVARVEMPVRSLDLNCDAHLKMTELSLGLPGKDDSVVTRVVNRERRVEEPPVEPEYVEAMRGMIRAEVHNYISRLRGNGSDSDKGKD